MLRRLRCVVDFVYSWAAAVACFRPLAAYQAASGDISFYPRGSEGRSRKTSFRPPDLVRELSLPCGQCIGCKLERSRQWAIRCMHESQMHDFSSFVTLTYNDETLPEDHSLNYRHYQLFMKRLRKHFASKCIRFYMCGEYGENTQRPHYHACLFNAFFPDRKKIGELPSGSVLYTSPTLESLWGFGNVSIGDVTFESAGYVARYITKKMTGPGAAGHYEIMDPYTGVIHSRTPEFSRMSLKPGIGATWFARFKKEVYPLDRIVVRGMEMKPPKFYDRLLELESNFLSDDLQMSRYLGALERSEDNTEARLMVREKVAESRLSFKLRTLK